MPRDYYEVLELGRESDEREIKRAYRKLAMEHHPDRNPDDAQAEERFKEASEAYEVLSDPQKRRLYDTAGFDGLRNTGYAGFSGAGIDDIFANFGDIFGDLFGFARGRGRAGVRRGSDIRLELVIAFEEAIFGVSKEVNLEHYVQCEGCGGNGSEPGTQPTRCGTCNGRGQVVHGQGMFLISTTCPDCRGRGSRNTSPCKACKGEGRAVAEREITVKIPAGFDDGMSLRYTGEGEPAAGGGPAGDLYIHVRVRPHESLKREGDELITELSLSMVEAALGAEVKVDGVEGPESVTIPRGTQPGDVITLKKRGVPRLRGGGRGGLHVVCKVEIPRSLSGKQKKLLQEFAELGEKKRGIFS